MAMAAQIKSMGLAGVTAYGVLNTLWYTIAFSAAWHFKEIPSGLGVAAGADTRQLNVSVFFNLNH